MHEIIETKDLWKSFGRIEALRGASLISVRGVSGLVGPNGAGKTTLINILIGLIKPDRGEAYVLGLDVLKEGVEIRRRIRVLQEDQVFPKNMSLRRYLLHAARLYECDVSEVSRVLKLTGLIEYSERSIKSLSAGLLQRLRLAQALIGEPELIILDEPTKSLDPLARVEFLNIVSRLNRDRGVNFLISSHILPELEKICNWFSIINRGVIVAQGTLIDLASKIPPTHKYRIVSSDNSTLVAELKNYKVVEETIVYRHYIEVAVKDSVEFLKILAQIVKEKKLKLYRLESPESTLEYIFEKVVRK